MELSNYDYGLLFIFKTCADVKSFSKASKVLQVKQPTISYSIKKIEELLNVKLFERTGNGVVLTNEGKILYQYIVEANNNIQSGLKVLNDIINKEIIELKIGISLNIALIYLEKVLRKIKSKYPNLKIEVYTNNKEEMLKRLQSKELDIVICTSLGGKIIPNVKVKKIKTIDFVCVANKRYKELLERNDNKNITVPVLLPTSNTELSKLIKLKSIEKNLNFECFMKFDSSILAKQFLLADFGIGFINKETVINEINSGELFIIDLDFQEEFNEMNIAIQDKNNNVVIQEFIRVFKKMVSEELK